MIIVGIIGRPNIGGENKEIIAYKRICDRLFDCGVFPVCLVPCINDDLSFDEDGFDKLKDMISICHGVVLQGGEDFNDLDIEVVRFLYDKNIPVLGICLGMQMMGKAFNGVVLGDACHNISRDYVHFIKIDKNSKLYDIILKEYIYVNSKHNDRVYVTDLDVSASYDFICEALEDKDKDFFIGVQWHPEALNDENSDRLFLAFVSACKLYKNNI